MTATAWGAFLAAAVLATAAAGAESERLAAEAARQVAEFESLEGLAVSSNGAGGYVDPKEALEYCEASPMTIASLPGEDLEILQACESFVERDPARCRALPAAFISRNSVFNCLGAFGDLSVFLSLSSPGPESRGACEAGFGLAEPMIPPPERGRACSAVAGPGDESSRCLALRERVPVAFRGRDDKVCGRYLAYLLRGEGCAAFRPGSVQGSALCPAFAAFRSARSAGDLDGCGEDYLCRALMGDRRACARRRQNRISAACARRLAPNARELPRAPVSPAMHRAVLGAVSLSVDSLIDAGEREALERLHAAMLRERPFDPVQAVADMARLRGGILEDLMSRAEDLASAEAGSGGSRANEALGPLRSRFRRAQGRLSPPRGGVDIRWVAIEGGSFLMGSADPDLRDSKPIHPVAVKPFEMAKAPVTNGQYGACVAAGACSAAHVSDGTCFVFDGISWKEGKLPLSFQGDDQPAVCVDWGQARAFAEWTGARLPSEAEWEFAARGGGKDWKYPWGNEDATCERAVMKDAGTGCPAGVACDQAALDYAELGCRKSATWPVCSKPRGDSADGLCDMAGNVWQWTQDVYHDSYLGAPADGSAWENPAGAGRVDRGGSWTAGPERLRSAWRNGGDGNARRANVGFRLAR